MSATKVNTYVLECDYHTREPELFVCYIQTTVHCDKSSIPQTAISAGWTTTVDKVGLRTWCPHHPDGKPRR
jgi:hypothetical protein